MQAELQQQEVQVQQTLQAASAQLQVAYNEISRREAAAPATLAADLNGGGSENGQGDQSASPAGSDEESKQDSPKSQDGDHGSDKEEADD